MGMYLFYRLKVENIKLKAHNRAQFVEEATKIYNQFIPTTATRELNIPSQAKKNLAKQFAPENVEHIAYNVFEEAQTLVFNLMGNDTYSRFCHSEGLRKVYQDALARAKAEPLMQNQSYAAKVAMVEKMFAESKRFVGTTKLPFNLSLS
jgi:hypothetical protein